MENQIGHRKFQVEYYNITATHNTPVAVLQSPVGGRQPRKPYSLMICDSKLAPTEEIVGLAYTLSGTVPQVTVTFGTTITRQVTVAVFYEI